MSNVVALRPKKTSAPTTKNRNVAKTRDYLTPDEVDKLMAAAATRMLSNWVYCVTDTL